MKSKLNKLTWNAKKWREENEYTTPEWEMYVENRKCTGILFHFVVGIGWVFVGIMIAKENGL